MGLPGAVVENTRLIGFVSQKSNCRLKACAMLGRPGGPPPLAGPIGFVSRKMELAVDRRGGPTRGNQKCSCRHARTGQAGLQASLGAKRLQCVGLWKVQEV